MLIPLACDGHRIKGIEIAKAMNDRTVCKLSTLDKEIQDRITLVVGNALLEELYIT